MTIIGFLRIVRKHMVILLFTPLFMAGLVILFTKNPNFKYTSETTLYTGLASGSSVEMGKSLNYFATSTDFDNLINVINSRETQQEVAIRLLAQHLMLSKSDPRYISSKAFNYLQRITPAYVKTLVVKSGQQVNRPNKPAITSDALTPVKNSPKTTYQYHRVKPTETLYSISQQYGIGVDELKSMNRLNGKLIKNGQKLRVGRLIAQDNIDSSPKDTAVLARQNNRDTTFSFTKFIDTSSANKMLPASINESAFEQTVRNLSALANSSDTNFVFHLLNYNDPHYSIGAISSVNVQRINSSDLVKLRYTADDPGICQQTLYFLTEVCIKNYRVLKENRSDAVVKYFEFQVDQATQKLKIGEDKLLSFNTDNNIINYSEQTKAVALAKEALDVDYNNMKVRVAGYEAAIKRLEEKLNIQQRVQLKSLPILEKRDQLSQINTKIATLETVGSDNKAAYGENLHLLNAKAEQLKGEIHGTVGELYHYQNTTEGVPVSNLLNEWITNVVNYEDAKAGLGVLANRIKEVQKQYAIYAPAGANLKRIEREISVSEQEYLELLHGLNLAKLKMQDLELSSTLKPVDQPYYPITPNPTKRKLLVLGAALFGLLIVFSTIMILLYFDETLRDLSKAAKILNLLPLGAFPKIYLKTEVLNFPFITQRLLEIMVQQIELLKKQRAASNEPFQILLFSTLNNEGKTVIAQNLALQLKKTGNSVLVIKPAAENNRQGEYPDNKRHVGSTTWDKTKSPAGRFSFLSQIFGYSDNRVDSQNPLLREAGSTLSMKDIYDYQINPGFLPVKNYKELLFNNQSLHFKPDYVLIELPSILYNAYPSDLVSSVDLPVLICRANRAWTQADQGSLEIISKVASQTPLFVLNGVELEVVESILGELPKKRNVLRKLVKKIILFDFSATNHP